MEQFVKVGSFWVNARYIAALCKNDDGSVGVQLAPDLTLGTGMPFKIHKDDAPALVESLVSPDRSDG